MMSMGTKGLIAYQVERKRSKLNILSFSINAVQHRISLMSEHIKDQVIDQVKSAGPFALQLDESTDVLFAHDLLHS